MPSVWWWMWRTASGWSLAVTSRHRMRWGDGGGCVVVSADATGGVVGRTIVLGSERSSDGACGCRAVVGAGAPRLAGTVTGRTTDGAARFTDEGNDTPLSSKGESN